MSSPDANRVRIARPSGWSARSRGRAAAEQSLREFLEFFTADAEREIRSSTKHIATIDLARLVSLWQQHYDRLRETGKTLLPLVKVYFLAPAEE